ncbi:FRIGIDA-like protein 4b [Clarias magur]|uniref:FRIGIDA-like protein 4b n=1 Tax=Clarias magur TaxID=1594786 RepID=A0A8J4UJH1_CLAMG|nr:FRIGIDA-like protein 4b [Clarias magur]
MRADLHIPRVLELKKKVFPFQRRGGGEGMKSVSVQLLVSLQTKKACGAEELGP